MLRALAIALLLANLAFYGWTQGWLDDVVGVRAHADREPERLNRQVRPDLVHIQPLPAAKGQAAPPPAPAPVQIAETTSTAPAPAAAAPSPPPAPVCLEAGPFGASELTAAEVALKAVLAPGSWSSVKSTRPGLWMVYLGRFSDRDALLRRQEELRAMKVEYDELRSPPELAPGLSLGRFEERGNASNALEKFTLRGIRGARIIEVRAPSVSSTLRVEKAAPAQASQLLALKAPALGSGFAPCSKP